MSRLGKLFKGLGLAMAAREQSCIDAVGTETEREDKKREGLESTSV